MDSYDLFGEDGGSSVLDGLSDFGGENLDGGGPRDGGYGASAGGSGPGGGGRDGGYGSQSGQQQPPTQSQYGQPMPQESPLAKLASFGGDFSHMDPSQTAQQQQHQQQNMYHQGHPYNAPPRPIAQSGGGYQPHMRSMATHRPPAAAAQYTGYPGMPDNMYGMDRQTGNLQTWNGPSGYSANMRHYPSQMTQPQPSYRSHMNYPQQQAEKLPQQYPAGGQMMGYQQYPPSSHYGTAGQYDNYSRVSHQHLYQQTAPQSPQYPHGPHQPQYSGAPQGYSHMQPSQLMGYHQQTAASMPRPAGDVPPVPGYAQKSAAAIAPALGGSSPQYRAPFPQLSPQISPRPQMSPRPQAPAPPQPQPAASQQAQQMSPRPVMSPAKPTTQSPHPLTPKATTASPAPSVNFPPQSTLQQLEQMVPPYQSRQNPNNPQSPALGGARVPVSPQSWPPPNSSVDNQLPNQDSMPSYHSMSAGPGNDDHTSSSSLENNQDKQKHGMDNHSAGIMEPNNVSPNEGNSAAPNDAKSHEPKSKPHVSPHHSTQVSQGPSPHPSHPSPQPLQSPHQTTLQSPHQQAMHSPHHQSAGSHQTALPTHPHQTSIVKDASDSQMDGSNSHNLMGPGQHQQHHMGSHMSSHLAGMGQQRFPDYNTPAGYGAGKMEEMYPPALDQTASYQQGLDPRMMGRQQGMYSMSGGSMMGLGMGGTEMFSHQQEIAALQQQLQELYCMPPAPIHQERITTLEERLRTLQQHEAATNCQGGPLCVLPGPMFGASLIQGSPQVTSTTGRGRGRGRGPAKPRKTKKQKLAEQQQQQLLEQQQQQQQQQQQLMMQQQQQQQQFRQMNYQSKGMPHEMSSLMAGNMGNMANMGLMNNLNMPPSMAANNLMGTAAMQMPPAPTHPSSLLHSANQSMMGGMNPALAGLGGVAPHMPPLGPMPHPMAPQNKMVSPPHQPSMPMHMPHAPPPPIYPPTQPTGNTSPARPLKPPTPPPPQQPIEQQLQLQPIAEPTQIQSLPPPPPQLQQPVVSAPVLPSPMLIEPQQQFHEQQQHHHLPPVLPPVEEPSNSNATSLELPEAVLTPEQQYSGQEQQESSTCDVDSSTNPDPTNPYDYPAESPAESFRTPDEPEIDPYLMTDEALGGEIVPRKIRKPRKTKEPKTPKEPKAPKEGKIRRPRTPKATAASPDDSIMLEEKKPRKKRESKAAKDATLPKKKRGKKRKMSEDESESYDVGMMMNEPDEKRGAYDSIPETPDGNEVSELSELSLNGPAEDGDDVDEPIGESVDLFSDVTPKKRGRKRDGTKAALARLSAKKKPASRKKKTMTGDESEDEGGVLASTPPPSPGDDLDNPNKRRSARNTQRKKYCDDIMLAMSDDDSAKSPTPDSQHNRGALSARPNDPPVKPNFVYVNTTDEDSMVVQHILAVRKGRREIKVPIDAPEGPKLEPLEDNEATESEAIKTEPKIEVGVAEIKPEAVESVEKKEPVEGETPESSEAMRTEVVEVDEYLVKYRNFSYLHCEWKTEEELRRGDRRTFSKIKRFQIKMANSTNLLEYLDDEPFNPDFVEIDRVLDAAEHSDPAASQTVKHYLVKWRSMQYDDSTWELEDDVDRDAILQFERFRKLPPKDKIKIKRRPTPEQWRKLDKSPVFKNNNTLRPYQLEGLNWLLFSWHNGRNCILADEMGLGKTIQSLTFVKAVHDYGIRGPFLVIAPLSTIPNWQREFEGWTDLNVIVYHGSAASLQMIQEYEFYYKNEKGPIKDLHKFNVLITTFELIITHSQELKGFNWRVCVIDEAHRLKNRNCKLLEGLRLLNLEHRVLLSGTPLQNNVNELFSLLNFLEPSQFASGEAFLQEFGALKSETEVNKLQAILKPMMLRRMKEDVEKSLAPKEETVVEVELTNIQKKYYRGILEKNFTFLAKGTTTSNIPNLMNTMMELRKCCIHPYLLNGAEEQIQFDFKAAHGEDSASYYKALINSSGKMVLVDKLLPKLKSNGHRVLIFSQMVKCLDILEDYLIYRKYPFERIDGRIRGDLRQAAIDRFCRPDSDRFVFLLCTKAGGLGINLTAADTVIIYDSDWNPQNDLQAQARCHRIGQQKAVKVYRLICRNTYEREMFDKASLKLGLDKAVLQSMNTTQGGKEPAQRQLSKKEIEDLLKRGAYGAVMDEDAGDKFCEEDIDQILERRTQVITLESEKGSTFSKASFASSDIREDINIDDPDFWKKWAKRAEIDTTEKDEMEQLVMSEPRRRTQIKRYGQDDATLDMSDLGSDSGPSIESDDDTSLGVGRGRGKKSKLKRRHGEIPYGAWSRSECFKVEKGLLTYGWDRWHEIMITTQFRKGWRIPTVEDCARIILVYCLRYYRGDEKIRNFIWDLISPPEMGSKIGKNHHGLSAPVPRGRNWSRSKYKAKDRRGYYDSEHWSNCDKYDGELLLESTYQKHLSRHANKVLLRVRLLYYIKHEIIGDLAGQIAEGIHSSLLPIHPPICDLPPASWWDMDADRSLLVGTYKHGYEAYTAMRNDPSLSFLARVGPDLNGEQPREDVDDEKDLEDEDETASALTMEPGDSSRDTELNERPMDDSHNGDAPTPTDGSTPIPTMDADSDNKMDWPSIGDLNSRLRRVITAYQKNFRKEEIKQLQKARKLERREKIEQIVREREKMRLELSQRKWSRREEVDFFRTISSFGVEYNKHRKQYDWNKFRSLSRLEKKTDESMTEYYNAFYTMLKRSCGLKISEEEECQDLMVEPLSEDKARKTLEIIELLSKIREEILPHPRLDQRLRLCKTSADVPDWWVPGKHDKDLLIGVAKHGLARTDYYLLNDPELSFKEVIKMSLVDDPASFLRERFAESFKSEFRALEEKASSNDAGAKSAITEPEKKIKEEDTVDKEITKVEEQVESESQELVKPDEEVKMEVDAKKEDEETEKNEQPLEEEKKEVEKPEQQTADPTKTEDNKPMETEAELPQPAVEDDVTKETADSQPDLNEAAKAEVKDDVDPPVVDETPTAMDTETQDDGSDDETPLDIVAAKQSKDKKDDTVKKSVDESIYDFEDSVEPKPSLSLTHERTRRRSNSETEGDDKEESDEELPIKETKDDLYKDAKIDTSKIVKHFKEASRIEWPRLPDYDTHVWSPSASEASLAQLIAHSYQNPVKWPRDHAVIARLHHIIHAVECKEWPASTTFSAATPERTPDLLEAHSKKLPNIAIDVETERAKLHALLNCAAAAAAATDESLSEDSRRSTPSNLQPPPAHQQSRGYLPFDLSKFHATTTKPSASNGSSSSQPMDLSKAQDLSMVQDLSAKKSSGQGKSKLDNMLDKLLKRKNIAPEEPIHDKEKKRRKLDEIVMGLSAAREQHTMKGASLSPSVTVTPAGMHPPPPSSTPSKPFTITVTSVPAEPKKDSLSNFLSQAEQQQNKLLMKHQQALLQQQQALSRKSYEAMVADFSKIGSYSQEAKVNKWLADQTALMSPEQAVSTDYLNAARRRRPRVDPTLLDWKKLTGDENVSVINRTTGKKITGSKAPSLRRLAQWLLENPSYDVDPKWAELVKERGNLPHELQKRLPGGGGSSSGDRKAKGPGRPALLNSPPETPTSSASGQGFPLTSSSLLFDPKNPLFDPKSPLFDPKTNPFLDPKNSSLFDSKNPLLDPKSLSLLDPKNNPLFDPKNSALFDPKTNPFFDPKNNPFLDPKNNSLFDPKNNPLFDPKNPLFDPKNNPLFDPKNSSLFDPKMFLPFGGLPNMGALGAMNPLGNPMNLFANLASLGLPSLAGLDGSGSGMTSDQAASPSGSGSKAKPRKGQEDRHGSSGKTTPVSAASQLPYFFPNPSMLYSPLSLSGLNPFSLPPSALSSAYDSLAQQCNLLNGGAGSSRNTGRGSGGGGTSSSSSKLPMGTSSPRHRGNSSTSSSPRDSAASSLQHLLLPHDTQLLESLSRKPKTDSAGRATADTKQRKPEHKDLLSTQSLLMSSLSEMDDRMLRRFRDGDMKEALEALSRTSAEFLAKSIGDAKPPSLGADVAHMNMSDLLSRTIDDNRPKEVAMKEALALSGTSMTEVTKLNEMMSKTMDAATPPQSQPLPQPQQPTPPQSQPLPQPQQPTPPLPPPPPSSSSSSKSVDQPVRRKRDPEPPTPTPAPAVAAPADVDVEDLLTSTTVTKSEEDQQPPQTECEAPSETETASEPEKQRAAAKRTRGGKKSRSKSDPDEVPAVERKNLRSSAGRAARAAAERAAREASREDDFPTGLDSHDES